MGTKTQKQRKCCYHNLNAKQLTIPIYRSVLMTNIHQTQGGKFGANAALSRNCNEIVASLSQDARRFFDNYFFHLRGMDDG